MWGLRFLGVGLGLCLAVASGRAAACSNTGIDSVTRVIPGDGATGIPTDASILVRTSAPPGAFSVTANGAPVTLGAPEKVGVDGRGVTMWRLGVAGTTGSNPPLLAASTEYVVSGPAAYVASFGHGPQQDAGGPVELSRFTTASGPRKTLDGSAPVVTKLSLLRVRYPISEIGSGDCVFDEYIGYVSYDFQEATFPGVDARAIVYHARLRPKNGSSEHSLLFVGDDPRYQRDVRADPIPDPGTDWMVDLDPTREHCLTLDAMPNGEASQTLVSEPLCAKVEELARPGVDAGASDTPTSRGGGCAASGGVSRPSNGASWCLGATLLVAARLRRRRRDGVAGTTLL